MARNSTKITGALTSVLVSMASDACQGVEGISLVSAKRNKYATSVSILPNEKVCVELFVNIEQGYTVPATVAALQEKVKMQIENATKYKVQSINVQVMNVNITQ